MKVVASQALQRFDNVEFSNEILDGMSRPLGAVYTCPFCGALVSFRKGDFEATSRSTRSKLPPNVQQYFDEFASKHHVPSGEFLDWPCPGCGLAARVYVRHWAGGKHGDAGTSLLTVLEYRSHNV